MNTMNQPAHPELRRAALALHALGEDDQSWMLASLDQRARAGLQTLLQELKTLGIPRDEQLLRDALASAPPMLTPPAPAKLESMPAAGLWAAIRNEPATVQIICLALLTPEARVQVLRLAPAKVQSEQANGRHAATGPMAPALRAAIESAWSEAAGMLAQANAAGATP